MMSDIFEIHPSAMENINCKVALLLDMVQLIPGEAGKAMPFESDVHFLTIGDKDIIGGVSEAGVDYKGSVIGRFFNDGDCKYGIVEDAHKNLVKIAEAIQKIPSFQQRLSRKFIEESVFSWVEKRFLKKDEIGDFFSFFISEALNVVKPTVILVPIAKTVVEIPFEFCGTLVRSFSKAELDDLEVAAGSLLNEDGKIGFLAYIEKIRKEYQGYAVVEVKLHCEPSYANEAALSMASRVTDLLGIYSQGMVIPDVKCNSRIKGMESLDSYTLMIKNDSPILNFSSGIFDVASAYPWFISEDDLKNNLKCGFDLISRLAIKEERSEFESTVLNMAFLYSKSAFTSDPMEKLVHMLSSLESTLLKNDNEPIQQNLAERMAFFTEQTLTGRKDVIKNVRHVYGLRSRYLHHGHSSGDIDELSKFFFRVWLFYINLVANSGQFKTKLEFLEAIDDRKLSN